MSKLDLYLSKILWLVVLELIASLLKKSPNSVGTQEPMTGMNLAYRRTFPPFKPNPHKVSRVSQNSPKRLQILSAQKRCLRCNTLYQDTDNSPTACSFHGHANGEKGLFAFAPPHQGIDGEWSDRSGVIVYKWNDKDNRPNTGRSNWKKRWSCCSEYDENASPCQRGWHVSYDDGFTLY